MNSRFTLPRRLELPKRLTDALAGGAKDAPQKIGRARGRLEKLLGIKLEKGAFKHLFSPAMLEKAMTTLDKATTIILGAVWVAAVLACVLAFLAVKEANNLKLKADSAQAIQPALPKINRAPLSREQYQPLMERLKKQFPNLNYEVTPTPSLRITTSNGDDFTLWLGAVTYTDSMVPAIRWTLANFCVGPECPGEALMQAELVAEVITIDAAAPQ